jgi:gas vesicle protein
MDKQEVAGLGIAFGVGLVVGLGVALLYAPQSGKETRQAIKSKAEDVVANVRGKLGHGKLDDVIPH